jgi:AcrR family transcriptional regulator
MPRSGRRPGPTSSRTAILQAARHRFADAGYDATSIRAVAADAGVDPAVVVHFFGSKHGLFQAAVGWPFDPAHVATQLLGSAAPPASLGVRVARTFFHFWEDPVTRAPLLAVLRSGMTHAASATLLREFVARDLFGHITGLLDGPQPELRVDLASAQLIGVAVLRYALQIEPLASASIDELVRWLGPTLNGYLEQPLRSAELAGDQRLE